MRGLDVIDIRMLIINPAYLFNVSGHKKKKRLSVWPEGNVRPSGGLLDKERAESRSRAGMAVPGCWAETPLQPGTPVCNRQLFIFVLYSAVFLLKLVLEMAGALVLVNQDLETVPTGCWDDFSHQTAPFWWLHDPPAFASLLGSSTFGK